MRPICIGEIPPKTAHDMLIRSVVSEKRKTRPRGCFHRRRIQDVKLAQATQRCIVATFTAAAGRFSCVRPLPARSMPPIWAKSPKNLGALTTETLRNYFRFSGGRTVIQQFRGIDHDHDGILTLEEFIIGVRSIGFENATEEECMSVFEWLDDDGSGAVPYQELDKKLREHSTSPQQPASINRVLSFARLKTSGNLMDAKTGKGWMDRARTKVGRHKFEELMRSQGIDGDETLNSVEAFTKRQTLRKNRLVTEMLTVFWAVALSVAKHRPHGRPNAIDLSFDDYLITYKQIYRKLVGEDDYDEAEAEDSALEEFFRDAGGMGFMSQHAFVGGIFEVADLYVESLEAEHYADFLNDLLVEIAPAIAKASGIPPIDLKRDKEALLRVASDAEQAEARGISQLAGWGLTPRTDGLDGGAGGHGEGAVRGVSRAAGQGGRGLGHASGLSEAERLAELRRRQEAGELTDEELAELRRLERVAELMRRQAAGELTDEELAELRRLQGDLGADGGNNARRASIGVEAMLGPWPFHVRHQPRRPGERSPPRDRPHCVGCRGEAMLCVECDRHTLASSPELANRLRQAVPLLRLPMLSPLPGGKDLCGDGYGPRLLPRFTMAVLRPSRSLPPGALSCGYGYVGPVSVASQDPRIDQYRRAISSPQALKAFVEGPRTRHHRRSEILSEVIMHEDRRRDVYTPYIGLDDMIEVEYRGRVSGRAGLSTTPPPSPWSRPRTTPASPLLSRPSTKGASVFPSRPATVFPSRPGTMGTSRFLSHPGTQGPSTFPSRPGTMGTSPSLLFHPDPDPSTPWPSPPSKTAYMTSSSIRHLASSSSMDTSDISSGWTR